MMSVFDHPWLGGLFGDPETLDLWSAESQLRHYTAFECALARALDQTGRVAAGQGAQACAAIAGMTPDMADLRAGTARDGLPIPALVRQMRKAAGPAAGAVHAGATSQDVLDTALALTLRSVTDVLQSRLAALDASLSALGDRFGPRAIMARTRMQAALPVTVSDRLEAWRAPLADHRAGLDMLRPRVERLQLGGPVGTGGDYGADHARIMNAMARDLGLAPPPRAWHTDRGAIADFGGRVSLISGGLGKMGQDICLMAQQGIDELAISGGGGSSAMAHKANPVLAELLVTLARFNATQLSGLHQALVHEQERSGAAWMLEWMILPQMTAATGRALGAAQEICAQITRLGAQGD